MYHSTTRMTFNARTLIITLLLVVASGFLIFWGINSSKQSFKKPPGKLSIAVSFYPLFFFTKEIVDDRADVYTITPPGIEPHDYEPTPRDMKTIEESDLLIINGNKFEPWATKVSAILDSSRPGMIVSVQNSLTKNNYGDPHIWLNPLLAKEMVDVLLSAIIQRDPDGRESYEQNAAILKKELTALDARYREALRACKKRVMITSHESFGYMAKEYDLKQIAISGPSPDEEPSPRKLAELARIARDTNVGTIFFETLVNPTLAQTLAREVGARATVLDPIEGLSEEHITQGKNYVTLMEENLTTLKTALQCQ